MIQVETSAVIQCSLETVLAYVSDPRNGPAWQLELSRIAPARSPVAQEMAPSKAGAGLPSQDRLLPASSPQDAALSGLDRIHGVRPGSDLVECDAQYTFEPVDGGTCVTWTGRVSAKGRYRAVETTLGQIIVMQADASLALLKSLLEASYPARPAFQPEIGHPG